MKLWPQRLVPPRGYQAFGSQHQALGTGVEELRRPRTGKVPGCSWPCRDAQRRALSRGFTGMPAADMGDRLSMLAKAAGSDPRRSGETSVKPETRLAAFSGQRPRTFGARRPGRWREAGPCAGGCGSPQAIQSSAAYREAVALATSAGNRIR